MAEVAQDVDRELRAVEIFLNHRVLDVLGEEREVFRGGCFFSSAAAEFDGRPGPVRDLIAAIMLEWIEALELSGELVQH